MTIVTRRVKRFLMLCVVVWSALCSGQALAAWQAQVDRNPVVVNEPFDLILQSSDGHGGDPDLGGLKRDFDILGQSKSSSVQISNGQITQNTRWQISLIAKHSGQLPIPSIPIGGEFSPPISVNVSESSQESNQTAASQETGNLFVEVSAEPQAAHVQQQILFTVRLYSAAAVGNGSSLSVPNFPGMDAVIERLGEDRNFQTVRDGRSYSVIERRFALFPQKSGQFNSDPIVFDGNIVDQNQNGGMFMFNPFNRSSHHVRVGSKSIAFSIKPIPAGIPGGQWLPASKLRLEEQWSANPPVFTVGEPITRTVVETVGGLMAAQLPALDGGTAEGFKLYPDQPQLKDDKNDNGLTGRREQKIAYIPTRPGNVTLPAIEVKWWNASLGREEVASLPAHSFTVLPEKQDQAATPPASGQALDAAAPAGSVEAIEAASAPNARRIGFAAGWWPWLALFLGAGWCSTLFAWWRSGRAAPGAPKKRARVAEREETRTGLEKQLKKSCLENDPAAAKTVLLAWARQHWPQNPPVSLTALAHRCPPELAAALTALDRVLYAHAKTQWQGETLWTLYADQKPGSTRIAAEKTPALDSLYPT